MAVSRQCKMPIIKAARYFGRTWIFPQTLHPFHSGVDWIARDNAAEQLSATQAGLMANQATARRSTASNRRKFCRHQR